MRWEMGVRRLERFAIKSHGPPGKLTYQTWSALRDFVRAVKVCAPDAKRTHTAKLATAVLDHEISPEQVKVAES